MLDRLVRREVYLGDPADLLVPSVAPLADPAILAAFAQVILRTSTDNLLIC